MIDLHCHILPGIDDGAPDMAVALEMARIAASDGIVAVACSPHIMPGVYKNTGETIRAAVADLANALDEAAIPLSLAVGADVHLAPGLIDGIRVGRIPTIGGSRYFLLEPPHHVLPPRLDEFVFTLLAAGYVPILTHPERLSWIEAHYDLIQRMVGAGVLMQLTAGSLTGRFGPRSQYWSERMLEEDAVHLLATDAHNVDRRPPRLAEARAFVAKRFGEEKAFRLVATNPLGILENAAPSSLRLCVSGARPEEDGSGQFKRSAGCRSNDGTQWDRLSAERNSSTKYKTAPIWGAFDRPAGPWNMFLGGRGGRVHRGLT